jgi:hypothetical protein
MKRVSAVARVRLAQAELVAAEAELAKSARPWRRNLQQHRGALTLAGGFVSGLALTLLPPGWWARAGATVGSAAAMLARSALTPAMIGAVISRIRRDDEATPTAASAATPD